MQHPATHSGTYPRWAEERKRPIRKTDCSEHQSGSCSADVPALHSEFCQAERLAQLVYCVPHNQGGRQLCCQISDQTF